MKIDFDAEKKRRPASLRTSNMVLCFEFWWGSKFTIHGSDFLEALASRLWKLVSKPGKRTRSRSRASFNRYDSSFRVRAKVCWSGEGKQNLKWIFPPWWILTLMNRKLKIGVWENKYSIFTLCSRRRIQEVCKPGNRTRSSFGAFLPIMLMTFRFDLKGKYFPFLLAFEFVTLIGWTNYGIRLSWWPYFHYFFNWIKCWRHVNG